MSKTISKAQLDALERVVDRAFGKLGIDVEFTRHFLDRVNDERNRKQITIRELGELFAKEYRRWGKEIAKMPVDTQAVMKDLSSELNIPFVLNPDGKDKELVAKTIMRKKNFHTPNKELPVEGVSNKHRIKKGDQVKGSDPKPTMRKPTAGGQTPHPMRGRLVGEALSKTPEELVKDAIAYLEKRSDPLDTVAIMKNAAIFKAVDTKSPNFHQSLNQGWKIIARVEYNGTQVKASPMFRQLEQLAKTHNDNVKEAIDDIPLDKPTLSVDEIAAKHRVDPITIENELNLGIELEMEHTSDFDVAREIALDHLMELPNYYTKLIDMESGRLNFETVRAAWNNYQIDERIVDPREAILTTALKFLDQKVQKDNNRQSLKGLALDVAREVSLKQIGISHSDLAQLYRDWRGDFAVTEGWIEDNLYYLDEVIKADENFQDGKVKGKSRPGRAKRAGVDASKSVSALRKQAKNSSGEEQKMAHWAANMKAGRQKKNK